MEKYDCTDPKSIFEYSKAILGKSLRECVGNETLIARKGKGGLGLLVEEYFFGYKPNSKQEADFPLAHLELKCSPLKRTKNGELHIKERLVCTMIDFSKVIDEQFENSHLFTKCQLMLFLFYLHFGGVDIVDLKFLYSVLWKLPEKDLLIIQHDYELIRKKIRDGLAHEISEGDTEYLGACRKGAGGQKEKKVHQPNSKILAFKRAFALKPAYMRTILDFVRKSKKSFASNLSTSTFTEVVSFEELKKSSFEEIILARFKKYIGKSAREIAEEKGISYNTNNKSRYARAASALITTKVSHINKSEEFRKSGIELKTIRISREGNPEEALPFENINYFEAWEHKEEGWPNSRWYEICTGRFLFAVFRETDETEISYGKKKSVYILENVFFWTMPPNDLELAEKFWRNILENIANRTTSSTCNHYWKDSDKKNFHVRPKGRNSADKTSTPFESETSKMCYWFNRDYVKSIIDNNSSSKS